MTKKCEVHSVEPGFAIPGGEILVKYEMSGISPAEIECVIDGLAAPITAASNTRLFARVPEDVQNEDAELTIVAGSEESEPVSFKVGTKLCDNMHIVSNPAVDPDDGSIILTRSGTRGQEIPNTLFRYRDGEVQEIAASVMNPTAVAFDSTGRLFVSNRADGEVVQ
ncbi:MAG: hypothetical protein HKN33_13970, partial [Pyrinomonadaceae bacterium]|nr:hypothetical protein [Pyrinomonadaceae bacterium]